MARARSRSVADNPARSVPTSTIASGGSGQAAEVAWQAARRAILRCEGAGYGLPAEKFAQWREIEMVFNPARMRQR